MGELRPTIPDSAPDKYKKLEWCCDTDTDPDKRPMRGTIWDDIRNLFKKVDMDSSDDNAWKVIYHNDVTPLSRLEKESKYCNKLLLTRELPKPRNSYDLD